MRRLPGRGSVRHGEHVTPILSRARQQAVSRHGCSKADADPNRKVIPSLEGGAMTDDQKKQQKDDAQPGDLARREFVALSVAAGLAATAGSAAAQGLQVVETDVTIKTPDGTCDAAFIHPRTGSHAGVLIWADAFGLRPAFRDMAKRLAAEGYSVLVPNPFYRVAKAPVFADVASFNFQNQADRAKLGPLMGSVNAAGNAEKDAAAYIAFLDSQPQVNKARKIGTQGYCMGGPLIVKTAAAVANRVGAAASFHGGGLVTANPDSPHLLAPKIKARMYFGIAANDDKQQPDAKDKLKEAFSAAKVTAEVEVYSGSQHGWCVPDMPMQNGAPIYNKADADRAWAKLLALYKAGLA
jgi:carboxymethylenebutenolidase